MADIKSDISEISTTGSCYQVIDDRNITVYNESAMTDDRYTLVGNKFYNVGYDHDVLPNESLIHCYTYSDISDMPGHYAYLTPFLNTLAIVSAFFLLFAAYRLILYPFFRKS